MSEFTADALLSANLVVDALYKGSKTEKGGIADPLVKLVGVSRQGGFRYRGTKESPKLLVLTSNLAEPDWPDELDETTGRFVYYGDNRHPGRQLHDTPRFGNLLLRDIFDQVHRGQRDLIPPILVFTTEGTGRTFRFKGLAVPGHPSLPATEDLIAIWKTSEGQRFQNYRAVFTILDAAQLPRAWIDAIKSDPENAFPLAPQVWKDWVTTGKFKPLLAPRTQVVRTKAEQLPSNTEDGLLIETIRKRYQSNPFGFEACAGEITKLLLKDVAQLDLTRPWRDGGRDGIGSLRLGVGAASIGVTFALEAKCYAATSGVGVREVSRLISRIKHREFGVLVTTSYVDRQAYEEVTDDAHPVILVTARDIVSLLRSAGYATVEAIEEWLSQIDGLLEPR